MNKDFPRIISLLRKEKGLSQKQVAAELGISQALLSHYEKGIRECGLDFVVKVADYYNVSADYLLGRTPQRNGATITINELPEAKTSSSPKQAVKNNLLNVLNKKLIINSIELIYELLNNIGNKGLTTEVSNYLMFSVYKMFRMIYCSGNKNPEGIFSIDGRICNGIMTAMQGLSETYAASLAQGMNCGGFDSVKPERVPPLSQDIILKKYPLYASSLFSLIQLCENNARINNQ